jgi:hypothetical protein
MGWGFGIRDLDPGYEKNLSQIQGVNPQHWLTT